MPSNMNIIAIRDILTDKVQMVPEANFVIKDSDVLLVVCKEEDVARIK